MDNKKRLILIVFVVFFVLSAAVRAIFPSSDAPFDLSWSQGPSTDGSYYLSPAVDFVRGGAFKPISSSWNAPAYSLLYLPALLVFGVGFAQVNLTTVVLSLVAFVFFFLILRAFEDEKALMLACLFWAFTYMWAMFNRIPIIYTAMIMYMLIAAWLWYRGIERPVFFIGAWTVLLIATLFIKVIAVALVAGFLVGHLMVFLTREKRREAVAMRGLAILFSTVIVIFLIVLMGKLFNLSPLDVAAGRIKMHIREDIFGDNILLYIFNFGASGSLIERNLVVAFFGYCYLIVFIKDLMQKRIDISRKKDLVMTVFLTWMVFGGIATIFFRYAPPRFFLFLYPPLFILAAAALSRFLNPVPRRDLGYGFYMVLPLWLIFLVFHIVLSALMYVADNFETFVVGLGLSLNTAERILRILGFAGSFYLLLSVSLILSIIIAAVVFLFERRAVERRRRLIIGRGVRVAVVGAVVLIFLVEQGGMFLEWTSKPRYTLVETSRELPSLIGDGQKITGTYAHPLTMENDLKRIYMYLWDSKGGPPCERFEKKGITHLVIDTTNGLGYIETNYPETMNCLVLIETFYVRGNPIDLYLYTGAEGNKLTDYERAKLLMNSENFRAASELLPQFIARHPGVAEARVSLARCLLKLGDSRGAEEALRDALSIDPDNMVAHWGIGQILESKGDIEGALLHYREAHDLYPASKSIKQKLQGLQGRGK